MIISEIYVSRQGEGLLTGQQSVFLRTSGCNLRCSFCDTPFASWSPSGLKMTVESIVAKVIEFDVSHVVITGGEPMLPREIVEVCSRIRKHDSGIHITIETAGTIYRELECDLISISPKFSNSTPTAISESKLAADAGDPNQPSGTHEQTQFQQPFISVDWLERHELTRRRPEIVQQLISRHAYQLKFVVSSPDDLAEITDYLKLLKPVENRRVCLMPEGVDAATLAEREQWLVPICDELGFTFCPRQHIHWYGNKRGT